MSIVVAIRRGKKTVVASDSMTSFGSLAERGDNATCVKVRTLGSSLIAHTGWSLYRNILDDYLSGKRAPRLGDELAVYRFFLGLWKALRERYALVNEQCNEQDSPFGDLDSSFLVASSKGIFGVASDMSVTRYEKFFAIGSGRDYAYGALHATYDDVRDLKKLARIAVEAASRFDVNCGGEVQVFEAP